jgi:glycosyltransferase involved in cell wall biosynthesis
MSAARQPRLAIVIPVFKHPVLVTEALASALREARLTNGVVVVVNDGCPYPETHEVCSAFAAAEPDLVAYIRTPNGGLSAARNRGIKHALALFPSIEVVYLLDADNRLGEGAMRRAITVLDETGADWVYPNIDKFGLEWSGDFSASYNSLRHLFQNICEAGSLIHRRIFDAGIYFDEAMRQGYEDWEFWLQGLEAGFRGAPCAEFGLEYRARRESMVRDSDRDGSAIIAKMQVKHKRLFTPQALLASEHESAPRYCIIDTFKQRFSMTSIAGSSATGGEVMDLDRVFWSNNFYPTQFHFPNFVVFIDQRLLGELLRLKMADMVFWTIEDALEAHGIAVVSFSSKPGSIVLTPVGEGSYADVLQSGPCIVAIQKQLLTECVLDPHTSWIETILTPTPAPSCAAIEFSAPLSPLMLKRYGVNTQIDSFFRFFTQLRSSPYKRGVAQTWEWRECDGIIPGSELFRRVRTQLAAMAPLARVGGSRQNEIAFLLPLMSFGGVEQVGISVAARFKEAGWRTRLVVTEVNEVKAPERLYKIFDSILFLNDDSYSNWSPTDLKYYGHELQSWPKWGRHERLVGLLTGCAAVMVLQANHGYEVMGWLRRQGTITINSLHLLDRDGMNAPSGHPYVTLAYEHAFDIICAPGRKLLSFCAATGVPQEKLVYLANAPSFTVNDAILRNRARELSVLAKPDTPWRKLRVLSIGRLDRQKGGERLAALVEAAQALDLPIDWRFVGGRVVTDSSGPETNIVFEPPEYDRAGVIDRLLWADAVVLLSRWEGSPLIILEAQSLGTIPIATDTGAVCEMIENGIDGFSVPNSGIEDVVEKALTALERLVESPELRAQMGEQAMERMRTVTWENTAAKLVERVNALVLDKASA